MTFPSVIANRFKILSLEKVLNIALKLVMNDKNITANSQHWHFRPYNPQRKVTGHKNLLCSSYSLNVSSSHLSRVSLYCILDDFKYTGTCLGRVTLIHKNYLLDSKRYSYVTINWLQQLMSIRSVLFCYVLTIFIRFQSAEGTYTMLLHTNKIQHIWLVVYTFRVIHNWEILWLITSPGNISKRFGFKAITEPTYWVTSVANQVFNRPMTKVSPEHRENQMSCQGMFQFVINDTFGPWFYALISRRVTFSIQTSILYAENGKSRTLF